MADTLTFLLFLSTVTNSYGSKPRKPFMGKAWLITGAARGFGRLWAAGALARGDRVAASVRKPDSVAGLIEAYGDRVLPLRVDVTDCDAVFEAVTVAHRCFGRLDVVLSNAGYGLMGAVDALRRDTGYLRDQRLRHNLPCSGGTAVSARTGRWAHSCSFECAGLVTVPTAGIYEATKFAIEGFVKALAAEVRALGIRTTLIELGAYATDFLNGTSLRTAEPMAIYNKLRDNLAQMLKAEALGDPAATWPAIARLVDSDNPPFATDPGR
jgi:NAD(P)-dependent dehydrogenase (short-subunit alcohol dehydrogenase family)